MADKPTNKELMLVRKQKVLDVAKAQKVTIAGLGLNQSVFAAAVYEAVILQKDILKTDMPSFAIAIARCCQQGLLPNGSDACIIPMGTEATYIPMKDGLQRLLVAAAGGSVKVGHTREGDEIIYTQDVFEGDNLIINRKLGGEETPLNYAWSAWVNPETGEREIVLLSKEEVHRRRAYSASWRSKYSAWQNVPETMWEKTAIRVLCRKLKHRLPQTSATEALMKALDEDGEFFKPEEEIEEKPAAKGRGRPPKQKTQDVEEVVIEGKAEEVKEKPKTEKTEKTEKKVEEVKEKPKTEAKSQSARKTAQKDGTTDDEEGWM